MDNIYGDGKSQFVFPWISYSAIEERFMLEMSEQIKKMEWALTVTRLLCKETRMHQALSWRVYKFVQTQLIEVYYQVLLSKGLVI